MRSVMAEFKPSRKLKAELIRAALLELGCWAAGGIAFYVTGNWVWLACGIVGGLGFSLPAVIKLVREAKDNDRASR
jgi:F0F1-type ATP synthase assembly protein I